MICNSFENIVDFEMTLQKFWRQIVLLSFCLQPVSAMFALRHLPSSYLPPVILGFPLFVRPWLNICFSQLLSGDIKQMRLNFEVFISPFPNLLLKCLPSTLICIGRYKQTLLSVLITPLSHQHHHLGI